jgi:hypothetical protein
MLADERVESGDGGCGINSTGSNGKVRDIVADKADIGSGRTYYNLHKVMLACW